MVKKKSPAVVHDGLLLIPEGFIEERIVPHLNKEGVRVLQIRYLSDGPVITSVPLEVWNA